MGDVNRHYTVWPQVLSSLLKIPLVVNEADGGGSNHRTFRKTSDFILDWIGKKKDPKDLIIVIGWTTPERTEIAINGKYHRITSNSVVDKYSKKLIEYQRLYYDFYNDSEGIQTQVRHMQTLRQICNSLGIRYYDFITIGKSPENYDRLSIEKYGLSLDNLYKSSSWSHHVYLNKLPVHRFGHPTVETHTEWAEVLYKELI
jgi:hypothetical protein